MVAVAPRRVCCGWAAGSFRRPSTAIASGWLRLLQLLALLLAMAPVLAAAPPLGPSADPAPAVALSHRIEHLQAAFRADDPDAIAKASQEVDLLRYTYGTLDATPLVDAMTLFARQLGQEGRPDQGLKVIRTLEAWAPRDPELMGARIVLLRQQGLHGYVWSLGDVLDLTRLRLGNTEQRWFWVQQHLAWVRLLADFLLWAWALTLALRYRRVFRHLWEEPLQRRGLDHHMAAFLGAFLVALPVLAGLDPGVVAMLWLCLLAPFMLPAEIRLSCLLVLFQLVHPVLAYLEPIAGAPPRPSLVALQQQPLPQAMDANAWAALTPADQDFLRGWQSLQERDWGKAEAVYRSLAGGAERGAALNNLGVAQYQQGDLASARASFDQARALLPSSPEVVLNQSVVAFKEMDSVRGADLQEEAGRLAPAAVERMLAANHAGQVQRTFPIPLADTPDRLRTLATAEGLAPTPARPYLPPLHLLLVLAFNLALPVLAVVVILLRLRRSLVRSHPCQCARCGEPFHTTDSPDPEICSKCHHLFLLKDGLHAASRKLKVEEAAAFQRSQRWLHRSFMILLPGADRCFIGDTRNGFLELGFFCFCLSLSLVASRPVHFPGEILPEPASIALPVGVALLAVLVLRSWLKLLPRRG
jgi:tetratricopeptide (TPR) repeat protein